MTEVQTEPQSKTWLAGFKDIFFTPQRIPARAPFPVGKVAAVALLIYVIAALLSAWINNSHSGIRSENYKLRAAPIEMARDSGKLRENLADEQLKDLRESFTFKVSTALQATLLTGVMWLLFTTAIIWIIQNFLLKNSLTFVYTLAFVSFGNAIDAAGNLFKTLLHYVTGTIRVDPSLNVLTQMYEHPFLFAFLSRVDIFIFWQYIAIALAICAYVGEERRKAYILAAITIALLILYFAAGPYFGSMLID